MFRLAWRLGGVARVLPLGIPKLWGGNLATAPLTTIFSSSRIENSRAEKWRLKGGRDFSSGLTDDEKTLLQNAVKLASTSFYEYERDSKYQEFFERRGEFFASYINIPLDELGELLDEVASMDNDPAVTLKSFNFAEGEEAEKENFIIMDGISAPQIADIFYKSLVAPCAETQFVNFSNSLKEYLDRACEKEKADDVLAFIEFLSYSYVLLREGGDVAEDLFTCAIRSSSESLDNSAIEVLSKAGKVGIFGVDNVVTYGDSKEKYVTHSHIIAQERPRAIYALGECDADFSWRDWQGDNVVMTLARNPDSGAEIMDYALANIGEGKVICHKNKAGEDILDLVLRRRDAGEFVDLLKKHNFDFASKGLELIAAVRSDTSKTQEERSSLAEKLVDFGVGGERPDAGVSPRVVDELRGVYKGGRSQ